MTSNSENITKEDLLLRARELPTTSGVYLMYDEKNTVIYVGKALNLRSRVSSYFNKQKKNDKTLLLIRRVHHLDFISTANEYDALILENNLIKQYAPRYNINLKDGKTYPVIRITKETYPRVFRTRYIVHDGSEYFGPYPNIKEIDILLDVIDKIFPLRRCHETPLRKRNTPCLYYHIQQCKAPCCDYQSIADYRAIVNSIRHLLNGNRSHTLKELQKMMKEAASEYHFEEAGKLRDAIFALTNLQEASLMVDFNQERRDYLHCAHNDKLWVFSIIKMREGQVVDRALFHSSSVKNIESSLETFIIQYYQSPKEQENHTSERTPPNILYINYALSPLLNQYFMDVHKKSVKLALPKEKREHAILNMAYENALQELARLSKKKEQIPSLELLQEILKLDDLPEIIEGFDISHLGGQNTVASMIQFNKGKPNKRNYRYFAIKTLQAGEIDDYQSMREAITRRYTKLINENLELPNLLLVDGGQGQVNAAYEILQVLGIAEKLPVIGLAKRNERIVFSDNRDDIKLKTGHPSLKILQHIRDECHRFANRYVSSQSQKKIDFQVLKNVPGIGTKRSQKLVSIYQSLENMTKASSEELAQKGEIPVVVAETLTEYLQTRLPK